jgi:hypothetical protein
MNEYYIIWLDEHDIPKGILTGPFWLYEQACDAAQALQPLIKQRVSVTGGTALPGAYDPTGWHIA